MAIELPLSCQKVWKPERKLVLYYYVVSVNNMFSILFLQYTKFNLEHHRLSQFMLIVSMKNAQTFMGLSIMGQ